MIIESIRQKSTSWWFRGFLAMLALTLAFLWYGGDLTTLGSGGRMTLAVVGGEKIGLWDFKRALDGQKAALENRLSEPLPPGALQNLYPMVLGQLVRDRLIDQEGSRLNLVVTDDQVRRTLRDIPAFQDTDGKFNRKAFELALSHLGMTESHFVADIRQKTRQNTLLSGLFGGIATGQMPTSIGSQIFTGLKQTRTLSAVVIPTDQMPTPPLPPLQTLKSLYAKRADLFKAPEYRTIEWLTFDGRLVADRVTVTDGEVQEAYANRPDDFQGQTRSAAEKKIRQELIQGKTNDLLYGLTTQIDDAVSGGASLEELSKTYNLTLQRAHHVAADGTIDPYAHQQGKKGEKPVPLTRPEDQMLLKEAFALPENTTGSVVEVGEGQYILCRVSTIQKAQTRPYSQVEKAVQDLWVSMEQAKTAQSLAQKIRGEMTGNGTPSMTAASRHLRTVKIVTGREGSGQPSAVRLSPSDLDSVFTLPLRGAMVTAVADDARRLSVVVIRVDGITNPQNPMKSKDFGPFMGAMSGTIAEELAGAYVLSLENRFPVKENKDAITQLTKIRFEE